MAEQTAEALRRAATELGRVAVRRMPADERGYHCNRAATALGAESSAGEACDLLAQFGHSNEWVSGVHWLAQAAQLRLLVEEIMVSDPAMPQTAALGRMALTWWKEAQHG